MTHKKRDYYDILGVDRTASKTDIRRAYFQLAKKYHPDVSLESNAKDKFEEVAQAYAVLSNESSRLKYDRFGHPDSSIDDAVKTAWKKTSSRSYDDFIDEIHKTWNYNSAWESGFSEEIKFSNKLSDKYGSKPYYAILGATALSTAYAYIAGLDTVPFNLIMPTEYVESYRSLVASGDSFKTSVDLYVGVATGILSGLAIWSSILLTNSFRGFIAGYKNFKDKHNKKDASNKRTIDTLL